MILRNMMTAGKGGILNEFQGAIAAYSTRALTGDTSQPLMRVWRASDGTQQDFFANDDGGLDGVAILAFVGAGGEGRVVTWYDQSGNGNHATQPASINRPQIANAGFLWQTNGLPSINFIPSFETYLKCTSFSMNTNPHTVFSVVD